MAPKCGKWLHGDPLNGVWDDQWHRQVALRAGLSSMASSHPALWAASWRHQVIRNSWYCRFHVYGISYGMKSLPVFSKSSSFGGTPRWAPCCRRGETCAGHKGWFPVGIDPLSEVVWPNGARGGAYRVLRAGCLGGFFTAGFQQACRPRNPPGRGALGP